MSFDPHLVPTALRTYVPAPRATNVLIAVGLCSLGFALWMRYGVLQNTPIGLVCDVGAQTTLCQARRTFRVMAEAQVFGYAALVAAVLNLIRPHVVLFAAALALAAVGLVLYDRAPAGLAAGLLLLAFARPERLPEED